MLRCHHANPKQSHQGLTCKGLPDHRLPHAHTDCQMPAPARAPAPAAAAARARDRASAPNHILLVAATSTARTQLRWAAVAKGSPAARWELFWQTEAPTLEQHSRLRDKAWPEVAQFERPRPQGLEQTGHSRPFVFPSAMLYAHASDTRGCRAVGAGRAICSPVAGPPRLGPLGRRLKPSQASRSCLAVPKYSPDLDKLLVANTVLVLVKGLETGAFLLGLQMTPDILRAFAPGTCCSGPNDCWPAQLQGCQGHSSLVCDIASLPGLPSLLYGRCLRSTRGVNDIVGFDATSQQSSHHLPPVEKQFPTDMLILAHGRHEIPQPRGRSKPTPIGRRAIGIGNNSLFNGASAGRPGRLSGCEAVLVSMWRPCHAAKTPRLPNRPHQQDLQARSSGE